MPPRAIVEMQKQNELLSRQFVKVREEFTSQHVETRKTVGKLDFYARTLVAVGVMLIISVWLVLVIALSAAGLL